MSLSKAQKAKTKQAEIQRQLLLAVLKRKILYKGDDEDKQFEGMQSLSLVLGYYVDDYHEEIIRHQNLTQFGFRKKDLTLGFRGGGKSTSGTVVRSIMYIIHNPNIRILYTSDTSPATKAMLEETAGHLLYNEDLIEMFGKFLDVNETNKIGKTIDGSLTVYQRTDPTIKEPTIQCLSTGNQIASKHYDVIFGDDLVTEKKSLTVAMRKKLRSWYGATLIGASLPDTKFHFIGTRYFPNDLWQVLINGTSEEKEGELANAVLKLKLTDEDGNPNYPKRYPKKICNAFLKAMGRYHFNAQMNQDTSSAEGIIFSYPDFNWWAEADERGEDAIDAPPKDAMIFQFSDLVAKKTDTGHFFANCTIAVADVNGKRKIWVIDLIHKRGGIGEQRKWILGQAKLHLPVQAGVEAVAMQAGFTEEIASGTLLPIDPIPHNGKDKVYNARMITPTVEAGQVYFPMPETSLGQRCKPLMEELATFPNGDFDDCVDAFVGAVKLAMVYEGEFDSTGMSFGERDAYSI